MRNFLSGCHGRPKIKRRERHLSHPPLYYTPGK
nr:MAG TPA: hypothetical protein [Caudoviricetes sp.]